MDEEINSLLGDESCRNSLCDWKVHAGNVFRNWNTYEDMELYGILKEEWEQSANKPM